MTREEMIDYIIANTPHTAAEIRKLVAHHDIEFVRNIYLITMKQVEDEARKMVYELS